MPRREPRDPPAACGASEAKRAPAAAGQHTTHGPAKGPKRSDCCAPPGRHQGQVTSERLKGGKRRPAHLGEEKDEKDYEKYKSDDFRPPAVQRPPDGGSAPAGRTGRRLEFRTPTSGAEMLGSGCEKESCIRAPLPGNSPHVLWPEPECGRASPAVAVLAPSVLHVGRSDVKLSDLP